MNAAKAALYRQGIVAVIIDENGKVLLAERSDTPGSWQFPQGGIEKGEASTEACFREIEEELGNGQCEILKIAHEKTHYVWPKEKRRANEAYSGQEHVWFLCRFKKNEKPDLKKSDGCFRATKWEDPAKVSRQIIAWKREAYEKGLRLLGLIA